MTDTRLKAWRTNEQVTGARDAVRRAVMETDGNPHAAELWDALDDLCDAVTLAAQPAPASGGEPDGIAERLRGLAQSRNRGERVRLDADDCRALLAAADLLANQCDGCRRGMPLRDGIHYNKANSLDMIGCTAHLYRHPPASGTGSEDFERNLRMAVRSALVGLFDHAEQQPGAGLYAYEIAEWTDLNYPHPDAARAPSDQERTPSVPLFTIWSGEWSQWWRANRSGYTSDAREAGRYTREEADAIAARCGPEKKIEVRPAPPLCPTCGNITEGARHAE